MKDNAKTVIINVTDMTCINCEHTIEKKLNKMTGILKADVSYVKGSAAIRYNPDVIQVKEIEKAIIRSGYTVGKRMNNQLDKTLGTILILFALHMLAKHTGVLNIFNMFPEAETQMGYGMLFVIGLLTSVHCVAMCGGINLSQCLTGGKEAAFSAGILYNAGRVISYTLIGGIVGAIGSVISFSGTAKGMVQLLAGVFMIIMGLNMLNLFPGLKKFVPRMPKVFARGINEQKQGKGPLLIGLLNGLMPCGPLQAMQLYALSTGNPLEGALSMFLFSMGTVPLMLGISFLGTFMSKKFSGRLMTIGAGLVVVLGISMFQNGMGLSGLNIGAGSGEKVAAELNEDVQEVHTTLAGRGYEPITVKEGVPVKWTITAGQGSLNGCNYKMYIPEYDIEKEFDYGDNIIEFTPEESGTFTYSCWMGMLRSSITVE